ncbi:hypothetical protein LCGC14_0520920, partial [marine sediment metagenome]
MNSRFAGSIIIGGIILIIMTSFIGVILLLMEPSEEGKEENKSAEEGKNAEEGKKADEAAKAAKKIGFPLVMKVVSPQILHRTDVGGVKVGLENVQDVKKTFTDMYGRLSKKKGVHVKGILLEKMVPKGVELIVGLQYDPR